MEPQSLEIAGAMAVALASLRLIERMIDRVLKAREPNENAGDALRAERLAATMRDISETQSQISATLERLTDRLQQIDTRTKETGATVYQVREILRISEARENERARGQL